MTPNGLNEKKQKEEKLTLRSIMLLRGTKPKKVLASFTKASPTPFINPRSPPSPTSTQPVMFSVWSPAQFCAREHTPRSVT